jgi:cyclic pyranopterin phosphate synthase
VIGSVTRPFCVRLTADGQIRNCLVATTETDQAASMAKWRPRKQRANADRDHRDPHDEIGLAGPGPDQPSWAWSAALSQ